MKIRIAKKNNRFTYSVEYTEHEQKCFRDWAIMLEAFTTPEYDNVRTSASMLLQIRNAALLKSEEDIPLGLRNLFDDIQAWRRTIDKTVDARADIPEEEKDRLKKLQLALKIQEAITTNPKLRESIFTHIYNLADKITGNSNYVRIPPEIDRVDVLSYIVRKVLDLDRTGAINGSQDGSLIDTLIKYDPKKDWESWIAPYLRQKGFNGVKEIGKQQKTNRTESLEYTDESTGKTTEKVGDQKSLDAFNAQIDNLKYINLEEWTHSIFEQVRNLVMKLANKEPEKYELYTKKFKTYGVAMNHALGVAKRINQLQVEFSKSKSTELLEDIRSAVEEYKTAFIKAHQVFPDTSKAFGQYLQDTLEEHGLIPSEDELNVDEVNPVGEQVTEDAPVADAVEETAPVTPQAIQEEVNSGAPNFSDDQLAWIEQNMPQLARKLLQMGGKPGKFEDNGKQKNYVSVFGKPDENGKPKMKYYIGLSKMLHLGINSIQDLDDLLDETRTLQSTNYEAIVSHLSTQAAIYESRYRAIVIPTLPSPTQYKPIFGKFLLDLISNFAEKFYNLGMKAAEESGELESDPQAIAKLQGAKEELIENLKTVAKSRFAGTKGKITTDDHLINMQQANDVFRGLLGNIDPALRAAAYEMFKDELAKKTGRNLEWGGKFGGEALTQEDIEQIAKEVFEKVYFKGKADMSLKSNGKNAYEPAKGVNFMYPSIIKKELEGLNKPETKSDDDWMLNVDDVTEETKNPRTSTVRLKIKRFASKEELNDLATFYDESAHYEFADRVDRLIMKWFSNG